MTSSQADSAQISDQSLFLSLYFWGIPQEDDRSDSVDYMETSLYLDFSLFNS